MGGVTRWLILAGYWLAQGVVLVVLSVAFYGSTGEGHWEIRPAGEYVQILTEEGGVLGILAVSVPLLTFGQFLLVLPVHLRPESVRRGKSVYLALAAAGAAIAVLVVSFVAAVSEAVVLSGVFREAVWSSWAIWGGLALSWAVFTTLLVRYARRSRAPNHDLLTRVARGLFAGTVIETAALIPIDVMVRRKTDCYCWAGSLVALILAGANGLVVAGPAVFLPLVARRPLWLRSGRCVWCGYDLAGLPAGAACPECGRVAEGRAE